MSRYPSGIHQFISSFSLYWICMGHDYWRYRGEEEYLKTLLPAYRGVLSWYESFLKEDFSLAFVPHWFFGDWASNFEAGEPFREKDGNSAFQDLLFVMGLEAAADMEEGFRHTLVRETLPRNGLVDQADDQGEILGCRTRPVLRHARPAQLFAACQRAGDPERSGRRRRGARPSWNARWRTPR